MAQRMYDAKKALVEGKLEIARKYGKLYRIIPEETELDLSVI